MCCLALADLAAWEALSRRQDCWHLLVAEAEHILRQLMHKLLMHKLLTWGQALGCRWCERLLQGCTESPKHSGTSIDSRICLRAQVTIVARRPDDELLLLASDGLWDVLSNQEAVTLAKRCLRRARQRGASRQSAARIAGASYFWSRACGTSMHMMLAHPCPLHSLLSARCMSMYWCSWSAFSDA